MSIEYIFYVAFKSESCDMKQTYLRTDSRQINFKNRKSRRRHGVGNIRDCSFGLLTTLTSE
jgi:hypothetical protein